MRRSRGFPYGVGLVKNRDIGCTLITPDQRSREQAVRIKLGAPVMKIYFAIPIPPLGKLEVQILTRQNPLAP